ncbi:MAG TPA: tetratricopeptide repeat protein [bacterium]|nr:tetratricopeptide repeat protein [bacterium]
MKNARVHIQIFILLVIIALSNICVSESVYKPDEINRLINQGQLVPARNKLTEFVEKNKKDPMVPEALITLGRVYEKMALFSQAEQAYRKLYMDYPSDSRALDAVLAAGNAARREKRFGSVITIYEYAIRNYPDNPRLSSIQFELAGIFEQQGRQEEAIKIFKDLAESKDNSVAKRARRETVFFLKRIKRYYEAETYAINYLNGNPDDNSIRANLANIYLETGAYDKSIAEIKKLIELDPKNRSYETMMFTAYRAAGKIDELISEMENRKKKQPENLDHVHILKRLLIWDNRTIEAIRELQIIVKKEPDNLTDAVTMAKFLAQNQWVNKAVRTLEEIIEKKPDFEPALRELGDIYYRDKKFGKAREAWEKAAKFNPGDLNSYPRLARYYRLNQDYAGTVEILEEGRRVSGDGSLYRRELAAYYYYQMRFKDALMENIGILSENPGDSNIRKTIIEIVEREELAGEGKLLIEKELENQSGNDELKMVFAELLMMEGDFDRAISLLESMYVKENKATVTGPFVELARRMLSRPEFVSAAVLFENAWKMGQGDPVENLIQAGRAWINAGKTQDALRDFRLIVENNPDSGIADEALLRVAQIESEAGHYKESRELYSRMALDYPASYYYGDAMLGEAEMAFYLGDYDHAEKAFEALLTGPKTRKRADEILFYIAEINYMKMRLSDAEKLYRKIADQYPESLFINDALRKMVFIEDMRDQDSLGVQVLISAEKKVNAGQNEKALEALRKASTVLGDGKLKQYVFFKIAELLLLSGDDNEAIKYFCMVADSGSAMEIQAEANIRAATLMMKKGKEEEALKRYQKVISQYPRSIWAQKARASAKNLLYDNQ